MAWYWDAQRHVAIEATGTEASVLNTQVAVGSHLPLLDRRWYGPYATQADAQAAGAHLPTSSIPGPDVSGVTGPVIDAVPNLSSTIADYFVRAAEVVAGVVILAIAINALIRSSTGVDVAQKTRRGAQRAAVLLAK